MGVKYMVTTVFEFLYSLFICFCLTEIAALLFVSVHEVFNEKRKKMKDYYKKKHKDGSAK